MRVKSSSIDRTGGITRAITTAALGVLGMTSATAAQAAYIETNHQFVVNGGFEQLTNGVGELTSNTTAIGWTSYKDSSGNYGYNFIFSPDTASSKGSPSEYGNPLSLWGPGNGSNNGLKASPTGGNFLGADGAYHQGFIAQDITNLIVGQSYTLSFDWAGAQQSGFTGSTTESWYYGLANEKFNNQTATLNNASKGFTGWKNETFNFVATQTSDTLYFLAAGTPDGQPPFALLDSVSLTGGFVSSAPEPGTWAMLMIGFGAIGFSVRRRRMTTLAAA